MAKFLKAVLLIIAALATIAILWTSYANIPAKVLPSDQLPKAKQVIIDSSDLLSPELVDKVKKFVLFVGYTRSGHSIIGSLMDAHPHVIISDQYRVLGVKFRKLDEVPEEIWKRNLFNALYKHSMSDAINKRTQTKKGYSLDVKGLWQGKFDEYIEVIGDKSGATNTLKYIENSTEFRKNYQKLRKELSIPICIIHAVRNPFDMISTRLNCHNNGNEFTKKKQDLQFAPSSVEKLKLPEQEMREAIKWMFDAVDGTVEVIEEVLGRENVLYVHNCELVSNPKGTLSRIFRFIEVDTSEEFLDACAAKVFKSVSRSRGTVEWSPELIETVEKEMKKYDFLSRYSFTSD